MKGQYRLNRPGNAEQGSRFGVHLRQRRRGAKNETFTHQISALIFSPDRDKGTLIHFDKSKTVEPVLVTTRIIRAFDRVEVESTPSHHICMFSFENQKLQFAMNSAQLQEMKRQSFEKFAFRKMRNRVSSKILTTNGAPAVRTPKPRISTPRIRVAQKHTTNNPRRDF